MFKGIVTTIILLAALCSGASQEWLTDYPSAQRQASEEQKPIVLVFQGSDWCAPCIKLERNIWSSSDFKDYAKDNLVLVKADFPRKKRNAISTKQEKANKVLADKYNKNGIFPLVIMLDADGNVLGKTGYKKLKPAEYIDLLESFRS